MKKFRLRPFLRTVFLLIALLATVPTALADDFEEGGIYYSTNGTTATVVRSGYSGDVAIPNFVTHDGITYTVTAIGDQAFFQCPDLTGVVISDSVKTVGRWAFVQCSGLKSVTIGKSITTLRYKKSGRILYAFQDCDSITSLTWNAVNCADNGNMGTTNIEQVTIGDEVQVIPPNFAFQSLITEVVIPNSVRSIGTSAFADCHLLESIVIPDAVITISSAAFSNCELLESIDIPDAVTSIGSSAFSGCSSLTHVTLGNSVTSIGGSAFANCYNIERIDIPEAVTSIGTATFSGCRNMSEVTMGNSVTTIGDGAFSDCIRIEEITIPNTVTEIYSGAFFNCENLSKVNISSLEAWCGIVFGRAMSGGNFSRESSNPLYYAHHLYLNGQEITDLVIPESVTAINSYAFYGGSGFTCLTLGDAVTSIGESAFSGCTGLTSVTLGNSISTIGWCAFYGCTSLTSLTISKSVTGLGNMIGNCPSLTSLSVESGNPVYDSRNNCNAIIETATNTLIVGCQTTIIPNTVTSIGDEAFQNCSGLTSITIPNSVTTIGYYSFWGCKDLTTVYIPNSVTSIGIETRIQVYYNDTTYTYYYYNPFESCSSLRTMIVESGNPVYDSRDNCNAVIETATNTLRIGCLATVIPNTVTTIGDYAFYGSGLTSFDIPNSITSIGEGAFWYCDALTDIHIPNSVTSIGDYAFFACLSLKEITIPKSVITADRNTAATGWFEHCWSLERVTIGSGIAYMGVLFYDCPSITSVTCLGTIPPVYIRYQNSQTKEYVYNFDNVVYDQATLYVPASSREAYQSQAEWAFFQDIRALGDADGDGTVDISDVVGLIDYLLWGIGNGFDMGAADVNGDGKVDIADVTTLIDNLLNR